MKFGIIGIGSWGTAIAKILTDNNNSIYWWIRSDKTVIQFRNRRHNPHYLSSAYFDTTLLHLSTDVNEVIRKSDCLVIAVPSSYVTDVLGSLSKDIFEDKKIVSAIKGILPANNLLLNDYLKKEFNVLLKNYFTV
ncbi:MAG: NAD(P)-binding domain-containing protein, partial [Ginsengibacter sp.]